MTEVRAVQRAFDILEALLDNKDPQSLSELHRITGLSKTTVARLLDTLESCGYVERDELGLRYSLSMKLLRFGSAISERLIVKRAAAPILERIRDACLETVFLNIRYNDRRICVDCLQGKNAVTVIAYIGQDAPLYAGASAKVILADFSPEELQDYLDRTELVPVAPNTIINKQALLEELEKVRNQGYAISLGEKLAGGLAVSAPVRNYKGKVVASLSITCPDNRSQADVKHYIKLVVEGARELEQYEAISKIETGYAVYSKGY